MHFRMGNKIKIEKTSLKEIMENVYMDQQKRYISKLPTSPYCSEHITKGLETQELDKAICYPYIQNNKQDRGYIILDIDIENSAYLWQEFDLPKPTIICVNPISTRCHYFYELKFGIKYPKRNENFSQYNTAAIKFYEAVYRALVIKLKADPSFGQHMTKNPLHPYWLTEWTNLKYELSDFCQHLEIDWNFKKETFLDEQILGRNDHVFNVVRKMVINFLQPSVDYNDIYDYTYMCVCSENSKFDEPLPASEVRSITNSISKYSFQHKEGILQRKQIKSLTKDEIKERQRISANKTNFKQEVDTKNLLIDAINKFKNQNKKITITSLANEIGKNRSWISTKYSGFIKSCI